ncbi:hypothetical protein M5689_013562 [Euphorbia peplus]|nr:hypothetical protein M5689_013562 [Euphorbia peplus]
MEDKRHRGDNKFGRIINDIAKFAVDTTLSASLKGVTGPKRLYEIVQEKLKNPATSIPVNKCKNVKIGERMQLRVEEMLEDMGKLKQQNESSIKCIERMEKGPNEDSKRLYVLEPEKKRIFIRSRL